jgi:tetratricopeptide (TPR) repeat protein
MNIAAAETTPPTRTHGARKVSIPKAALLPEIDAPRSQPHVITSAPRITEHMQSIAHEPAPDSEEPETERRSVPVVPRAVPITQPDAVPQDDQHTQVTASMKAPLNEAQPVDTQAVASASSSGMNKWAIGAGLIAAVVVFGFWLTRDKQSGAEKPVTLAATISNTAASLRPTAEVPETKALPQEPVASASVAELPALPPLALRPKQTLETCDALLKRPFSEKQKPKAHMAQALWRKALSAMMRGKNDDAQKLMCSSAEWNIAGPASFGLAEFLMKRGDYAQAEVWANKLPRTEENEARRVQELLGDIHAQQAKVSEAKHAWLSMFGKSPQADQQPEAIAARYVKAGKQALEGKNDWLTERIFRRAVILDPSNADAAAGLAAALRRQKHTEAARQWVEFAVSVNNKSALAQIELLEQQFRAKEFEQAKQTLPIALELAPKNRRVISLARALK